MARRAVLWSIVIAFAALAAPAGALAAWQPPIALTAADTSPNDYELVATSGGETVAAWIEQNHEDIQAFAAVIRADGTFDAPVKLAGNLAGCVLDIATAGRGAVIVALQHADGQIDAFRRPPGGTFGPAEVVRAGHTGYGSPKVAMSPSGDAAILARGYEYETKSVVTDVFVSRAGGGWGSHRLSSDPRFGGYDVAMTPAGDAVAVWIVDAPEEEGGSGGLGLGGVGTGGAQTRGPSTVNAATLRADGTKSAAQVLRSGTSTKTCPQVEANALGQVAALWHEVEETQCGMWGADVLALRPAGATQFQTPEIVPGAQSAAALGILGLDDAGRLTVAYDGSSGGQLVSGPFGGQLAARKLDGGPVAAGTDQAGGDIVAVHNAGPEGFATVRHEPDGDLTPAEPFGIGGQVSDYMRLDQGAGRAAAMVMVYGQGLRLLRDIPGERGSPRQPGGDPTGSSPQTGPSGPSAAATPLTVAVRSARVVRRAVRVHLVCSLRCTVSARVAVTGRRGRRVRLASRPRSLASSGTLTLRLSRAAARRLGRGPYRIVARVEAAGPAGERAATVFRR